MKHADYPHAPGTLYDCPACESECFCVFEDTGQLLEENTCIYCYWFLVTTHSTRG